MLYCFSVVWVPSPSPRRLQRIFSCLAVSDTYVAAATAVSECFTALWGEYYYLTHITGSWILGATDELWQGVWYSFWKEGHDFRASLLTYNEQLQILHISRESWAETHQVWALEKLSWSQVLHLLICHVNIAVIQPIGYTSNLWSYTVIFCVTFNTFLVRKQWETGRNTSACM